MSGSARLSLATFEAGGWTLGLDLRVVREASAHLDVTPAPTAPAFVHGLLNLRGHVVSVMDLGMRLGRGAARIGRDTRLVILKTNDELGPSGGALRTCPQKVALLVDRLCDFVETDADAVEPVPPHVDAAAAPFLSGVCRTEQGSIAILRPDALLCEDEIRVGARELGADDSRPLASDPEENGHGPTQDARHP